MRRQPDALELACKDNPEMEVRLRDQLRKVAPYTTLHAIRGDAGAIYGLRALLYGETPKNTPFCSIRF